MSLLLLVIVYLLFNPRLLRYSFNYLTIQLTKTHIPVTLFMYQMLVRISINFNLKGTSEIATFSRSSCMKYDVSLFSV